MAGAGPGPAEEDALWDLEAAGCVRETTGADDAGPAEVGAAAALGLECAADEGRAVPPRAKLTATDAASTPAVTPAAVSGRHRRRHQARSRPTGADGPSRGAAAVTTTGFGEMYGAKGPMAGVFGQAPLNQRAQFGGQPVEARRAVDQAVGQFRARPLTERAHARGGE